jgi:WD40 repeat protein
VLQPTRTIPGFEGTVEDLVFATDAKGVMVRDKSRVVLCDLEGKIVREFGKGITAAGISENFSVLVTTDKESVTAWSVERKVELTKFDYAEVLLSPVVSANGKFALIGTGPQASGVAKAPQLPKLKAKNPVNASVLLLDLGNKKTVKTLPVVSKQPLRSISLSPDGKQAIWVDSTRLVSAYDFEKDKPLTTPSAAAGHVLRAVALGERFLLTSDHKPMTLWKFTDKDPLLLRTFEGPIGQERAVVSANGKYVVTTEGRPDRPIKFLNPQLIVRVWEVETGLSRVAFATPQVIHSLAISVDGRLVATGSNDGIVRIWDLTKLPAKFDKFEKPEL